MGRGCTQSRFPLPIHLVNTISCPFGSIHFCRLSVLQVLLQHSTSSTYNNIFYLLHHPELPFLSIHNRTKPRTIQGHFINSSFTTQEAAGVPDIHRSQTPPTCPTWMLLSQTPRHNLYLLLQPFMLKKNLGKWSRVISKSVKRLLLKTFYTFPMMLENIFVSFTIKSLPRNQ